MLQNLPQIPEKHLESDFSRLYADYKSWFQ